MISLRLGCPGSSAALRGDSQIIPSKKAAVAPMTARFKVLVRFLISSGSFHRAGELG
jgi:hypothetical protein